MIDCSICLETIEDINSFTYPCNIKHKIHLDCYMQCIDKETCPLCRAKIKRIVKLSYKKYWFVILPILFTLLKTVLAITVLLLLFNETFHDECKRLKANVDNSLGNLRSMHNTMNYYFDNDTPFDNNQYQRRMLEIQNRNLELEENIKNLCLHFNQTIDSCKYTKLETHTDICIRFRPGFSYVLFWCVTVLSITWGILMLLGESITKLYF